MKKIIIKIIFLIILIVLAYFVYDMYQFVEGVKQDAINNKYKLKKVDFIINKDTLFNDNSDDHSFDSIIQQEKVTNENDRKSRVK